VDGSVVFAEQGRFDEDFVLDGGVRMIGVIEVESVLGGDDPMIRVDAVVVGAEGEAAVAHGAAEHDLATAGEAAVQLVGIG